MAALLSGFSQAGSDNPTLPRLYFHSTTDTSTVVEGTGYFNLMSDTLNANDFILVASVTGGTQKFKLYGVKSNIAGVIALTLSTVTAL